jgi:uncharacterized protein YdaU (DUF1376 family)
LNYYRRYVGDYLRDTAGLSLAEHGAYTVLLDTYYATMRPLPESLDALYRLCRAMNKTEQSAVRAVAEAFFPVSDDGLRHNKRADAELGKAGAAIDTQRAGGSVGGRAKWGSGGSGSGGDPAAVRRERMRKARELGTHTQQEWLALVHFCGSRCVRCGSTKGLVRDHIKPVYQGGSDSIENIQPLCKPCNSSKGPDCTDMRPDGWGGAVKVSRHPSDSDSRSDTAPDTGVCLHPPTTNQNIESTDLSVPDDFARFWAAYPRKEAKAKALPAFRKQRAGRDLQAILADLRSRADEWRDRQFIPLPASYLNARRWEDERELATAGAEFGGGAL